MDHLDQREIERYVDGDLGRREAAAVEAHLEACRDCAAAVARVRSVGTLLRAMAEDVAAEAPLEGLADRVLEAVARQRPAPWTERLAAWLGETFKYRKKVWVPSFAAAGAVAAAAVVALFVVGPDPVRLDPGLPPGSAVLSVSFGQQVEGTLFQLEGKDGSTTAVIWVEEGEPAPAGSEVKHS